jgi:hypothetical protein
LNVLVDATVAGLLLWGGRHVCGNRQIGVATRDRCGCVEFVFSPGYSFKIDCEVRGRSRFVPVDVV